MVDKLTIGSGVMSELMLGTLTPRAPRKERGKVVSRIGLQVVVEITNGVCIMRAQNPWGKVTRQICLPL